MYQLVTEESPFIAIFSYRNLKSCTGKRTLNFIFKIYYPTVTRKIESEGFDNSARVIVRE